MAMTWTGRHQKKGLNIENINPSKIEDLLPSSIHKFYKKKQWRKQVDEQ
jgi:hypothetical protein